MFKDIKDLENFMIFCHTHYELNDVWHFKGKDKGILFDGPYNNTGGNQKWSPFKLPEEPTQNKRTPIELVYEMWVKVNNNLNN